MFRNFKWMDESRSSVSDEEVMIYAPEKTDYFCHPGSAAQEGITPESLGNAPFFYTEVTGDFVLRAQVEHNFADIYDSACIMVMQNERVWAKACSEMTDFGTHAVVSVVTNQFSDDANGCNFEGNVAWLQLARVDNTFAFHYSLDGERFDMMRFFSLPVDGTVKVGLLAQAPVGGGGERFFRHFSLEQKTVANIRTGK